MTDESEKITVSAIGEIIDLGSDVITVSGTNQYGMEFTTIYPTTTNSGTITEQSAISAGVDFSEEEFETFKGNVEVTKKEDYKITEIGIKVSIKGIGFNIKREPSTQTSIFIIKGDDDVSLK